jgi:hypothetical protein
MRAAAGLGTVKRSSAACRRKAVAIDPVPCKSMVKCAEGVSVSDHNRSG